MDLSSLPYMRAALQRFREEFPWTSDGLSRTERQIVTLVGQGVSKPGEIFVKNMDLEEALFIGDWTTFHHIADLCGGPTPLLKCRPHDTFRYPPVNEVTRDALLQQRLSLTKLGRGVLQGVADSYTGPNRDDWLGGIHLKSGAPMWMWDTHQSQLVLRAPN